MSDTELIINLQNSDVAAFDQLYWRYHTAVYFNILKLTKNKDAAEDILQDVFLALWEKRNTLDGEKSVGGWLFTISFNKAVDAMRKSAKEAAVVSLLPWPMVDHDLEQKQLAEIRLDVLDKALGQLSSQKQKVFQLCKLEGKTYEEAAIELQISKHTVKEYLSDSVRFIKTYVQNNPTVPISSVRVSLLVLLSSFY